MNRFESQKEQRKEDEGERLGLENNDERRLDALDMLAEQRLRRFECPNCCEPLSHFSGLEYVPEYYYCPRCVDWAYSDKGQRLFQLI